MARRVLELSIGVLLLVAGFSASCATSTPLPQASIGRVGQRDEAGAMECDSDADCVGGGLTTATCVANICVAPAGGVCDSDFDCGTGGNACNYFGPDFSQGKCGAAGADGCASDADCHGGACAIDGSETCVAPGGSLDGGGGGRGTAAPGATCIVDKDCAVGACNYFGPSYGKGKCGAADADGCTSDADCNGGVCADDGTQLCLPPGGNGGNVLPGGQCEVDKDCKTGGCNYLGPDYSRGKCGMSGADGCMTDADCNGGTCATDGSGNCGNGKPTGDLQPGEACNASGDCAMGSCNYFGPDFSHGTCGATGATGCASDADCSGGICATDGSGNCGTGDAADGAECFNDVDCASGGCNYLGPDYSAGKCGMPGAKECQTDGDCNGGTCSTVNNNCVP